MITNDTYIPSEYNTGIVRGDYFQEKFTLSINGSPVDLTDCPIRIQVKTLSNVLLAQYVSDSDIYVSGITLDETSDTFIWTILSEETVTFKPGTYMYDIEITIGGKPRTYVKGQFQVERDVTT